MIYNTIYFIIIINVRSWRQEVDTILRVLYIMEVYDTEVMFNNTAGGIMC